jgi:fructose-1,6-bisphosphatase/inositol monophosphatase family enzyme
MTELRRPQELLARIRAVHEAIRTSVIEACEAASVDEMARVVGDEAGDTVFAIDRVSERVLVEHFTLIAQDWPCLLVAEGLGHTGRKVLPEGIAEDDVEIIAIVDPIDGTRGLMYQKRPAWVLTGIAPQRKTPPTLADVELAVQTELPLVKQHLCDTLWALAGEGAFAERFDRVRGTRAALPVRPSRSATIEQGYGGIARFFPGSRAVMAAVDDAVVERVLGVGQPGRAQAFEDQYISSGGQLYELAMGHDRWVADLRPLLEPSLRASGRPASLCCHPYDLSTELVAREAGVLVTDPQGERLSAPLDVTTDVAWVGYANPAIRRQVEPALRLALEEQGLRSRP